MINKEIIEIVKNKLIETYYPEEIYLFGSFAWGKADKDSDIDLLIVINKSEEKPYKRVIKGIRALRGLKIPKDIIVYTKEEFNKLSEDISTLCYKIKHEGIKLYGAA
jgi:predicted nucleotidyltransferase